MPRLSKIGAACLSAFGFGTGGANAVTADYLVVAGGGGAGWMNGGGASGGGGAGGLLTSSISLDLTLSYTVIVGAGGAGGNSSLGANGSASSISSLVSTVGGGGGGFYPTTVAGQTGGSGGGGTFNGAGGSGTAGQGYAGGAASTDSASYNNGGGGGGAGAIGSAATSSNGGNGGNGVSSSITGTATYYAGGGGGGVDVSKSSAGTGGLGGGGSAVKGAVGNPGTANTGGGGGGSTTGTVGGQGGSGVVIVRYLGAQQFGGGIVSSDGTYTIHTFKTSGQLVPMTPITASYLIVAGGGGGSDNGGGGAGGLLQGTNLAIDTASTYLVTVGAGGVGGANDQVGDNGTNSSFSLIATTAIGGGRGGRFNNTSPPNSGGSGGGGGGDNNVAGYSGAAGTAGQGYAGGAGNSAFAYVAGGGGGAGAAGGNASGSAAGAGGIGVQSSISGVATYYAGGGGGGVLTGTRGLGGLGGGGNGGDDNDQVLSTAGTPNTGGGGGGGTSDITPASAPRAGGSGVVIISYAGSTQLMAGGIVTIVGGNVIHTFTSSGFLTPLTFIGRSLRFRSSATAYLSKTPTVAGSRTTWTYSAWVKRGKFGGYQSLIAAGTSSNTDLTFHNDSNSYGLDFGIYSGGYSGRKLTSSLYRDPAAWYHVVAVMDTTNAVAADRMRLYVNGSRVTTFSVSTDPSQNLTTDVNNTVAHNIGNNPAASYPFDGYLADVRLIDGQALTANSFGTFNSYGVWQPINYGGSYGTNGFYLPFSDTTSTTTLVADKGPQGNNWTPNNISLTAGSTYDSMTDVPTLTSATAANYATFNAAIRPYTGSGSTDTLSNGNLTVTNSGSGVTGSAWANMAVTSGSYYFEVTVNNASTGNVYIGVNNNLPQAGLGTWTAPAYGSGYFYGSDGNKYIGYTGAAYGSTYTTGDVIGVAFNLSTNTITFYKNNVSQGVMSSSMTAIDGLYTPAVSLFTGNAQLSLNCGQQPFAYTPPSGFVALNTYNL